MKSFYESVKHSLKTPGSIDKLDAFQKKITLFCFSFIGLPFLFGFGFYHFYNGATLPGILNAVTFVLLMINTVYLVYKPVTSLTLRLTILILVLLFIGHLICNMSVAILFWFFIVPLVSFFFVGLAEGMIWSIALIITVFTVLILNQHQFEAGNLSWAIIARFFWGFFFVAVFSFIFEYYRHKFQSELEEKNFKLEKEIQERLRIKKSHVRLAQAVYQSPATVVITDKNGIITYVNPSFSKISGYSADEAVGQSPSILRAGKMPESFYNHLWQTISSGNIWRGEFLNRKKSGEEYWESASISPIFDENESIINYVAVKEDITERKKSETALKKAKEEAEKAIKGKSEFLANMSHEIRTPLNAIMGFLSIAIDNPEISEDQRQDLGLAHKASKQMLRLMNDILDLSKLENGQLQLKETDFDFINMVEEILGSLKKRIDEKGLQLQLRISPEIERFLRGDVVHIKQAVLNIVDNAVKFTPKGSVAIHIDPSDDRRFLLFTVRDTGIGIPADKIEDIFEQFTQADSLMTRRFSGTGLGAAISKQLIELMGGEIWVESQVDVGSTFYFTIPMKQAEQHSDDTAEQDALRILLVEDVETNIILTHSVLEKNGHSVQIARNGNEAVEIFKAAPFDIVLMDVYMPEKDGIEATREIRQFETKSKSRRVPIIALTGSATEEEEETILGAGVDKIINKPIVFSKLFEVIYKLTERSSVRMILPGQQCQESDMPVIEGVNIEKGLSRGWKNLDVYFNRLIAFSDEYHQISQKLSPFFDDGRYDDIYKESHKLLGPAGNIGFEGAAEIAVKLKEAAAEKDDEVIQKEINKLDQAMNRFSSSVQKLVPAEPAECSIKSDKEIDPALLKKLLNNLIDAYEEYDPDSVEPHLNKLNGYFSDKELKKIKMSVTQLDFERAKKETYNFAEQLNINLQES